MSRPRGLPKTGGRQKGTPNKVTRNLRQALNDFLENNIHELQNCFDQLDDPKDKLTLLIKLAEFAIPKMRAVDNTHVIEQRIDGMSDEQIEELIDIIIEQDGK